MWPELEQGAIAKAPLSLPTALWRPAQEAVPSL